MIKGHKMSSTHKHSFLKYGFELLIPHRFKINVRSKISKLSKIGSCCKLQPISSKSKFSKNPDEHTSRKTM